MKRVRRRPVLIIQHAEHEHPAALRRVLLTQAISSLWLHPYAGERFPPIEEIGGILSLGGPMGANDEDEHPWIATELELLRKAVEADLPVAGICLGGQLLARAMGGRVERNPVTEVGWHPISLHECAREDRILSHSIASAGTDSADGAGSRALVYQWHQDTFFPPSGAELLASSDACERQAFRIGEKAYGFQFHPEADHQLVHEWLALPGVEEEIQEILARHGAATVQDAAVQRTLAFSAEAANIRITAGIGQLFKLTDYNPVPATDRAALETYARHHWELGLTLRSPDQREVLLRGTIASLVTLPDGEFVVLRDEDSLLWPIRLDHALGFRPFSK